jgi:hypothetical protein
MLGSCPCKVLSKIHFNGRRVSEPVREDKGKTTAMEPEDEKDPKRARVVLSKGCEVVRLDYSRLIGAAIEVTGRGENPGNSSRVNRVSKMGQHYMCRVSRVNQNNSMDWQADQVGWVSQNSRIDRRANRVSRVSNTEQKTGGSSQVANTERRVMENLANTESHVT